MAISGPPSGGPTGTADRGVVPSSEESIKRVEARIRRVELLVQTVLGLTIFLMVLVLVLIFGAL